MNININTINKAKSTCRGRRKVMLKFPLITKQSYTAGEYQAPGGWGCPLKWTLWGGSR